jgi:molybdenum cofactor cytidylyltransferase
LLVREQSGVSQPSQATLRDPARVAGLVLAAGTGSRFGGGKMRARLDGRPLVAHVLEAARTAGLERLVLVLGADAAAVRVDLLAADPAAVDGVLVAVNPAAERGLATSLRLGLATATADPSPGGVLILLGDQPRIRPATLAALLAADPATDALAVVADHAGDSAPNPVLLLWPLGAVLVDELEGDRGFGQLLAARPERVLRVQVGGTNPDVDTPANLAALGRSSHAR